MRSDTGSPETQVIIYAIQRGEYDQYLSELSGAIHRRRDTADRIGVILASRGDTIELFDDVPQEELRGAKLEVVGFTPDKRLRARTKETLGKYERGKILRISTDYVYRVHYLA